MHLLLRIAKWGLIASATLLAILLLFWFFIVAPRIQSKSEAYHASAMAAYRGFLEEVGPEAQFESHTCGLHTLRVIYKAYGLDPDEENLRLRLGVDVPSNPADPESTGTLQPDLLRVLLQDGFTYELLSLDDIPSATEALTDHLKAGHMAAILISRRENGNMHWVAAHKPSGDEIMILDSLFPEAYPEEPLPFMRDCVLSCALLQPSSSPDRPIDEATWDGSRELSNTLDRFHRLKQLRKSQIRK